MTVKDSLMAIKDFRVDRCKKHNLIDILMIVFFGLLCGYKSIEEIHFYAELSIDVLKRYLELPNGIPSSDTILRVLARIETKVLENVFAEYAKSTFKSRLEKDDVIAIDGKTECNSEYKPQPGFGKRHKAIHMVSAWATRLGVCFGQVKTYEKSNEITAIPELLELLDLKGVIVTIDAMGCQKKIAEKITKKHSDYLFSLKGNQESIHDITKAFFSCNPLDEQSCKKDEIQKLECETEIGHGRVEKREYFLCTDLKWFIDKKEWSNLNGIGMVRSWRLNKKTGEESYENRYFITSLRTVEKAAYALRSHWSIENNLHWVLDMIFDEDFSTVRKDNSAQNLNILRKYALNVLKQVDFSEFSSKKNLTIGNKQLLCDKCEECLEKVFNYL